MTDDIKTELVNHEVIEKKLLLSLEDDNKVAILASLEELDILIDALTRMNNANPDNRVATGLVGWCKRKNLLTGLKELRKQAFGA